MNTAHIQPSWSETTLSLVCKKITDGSHNPPKKQSAGLPMLSAKNIKDRRLDFSADFRLISKEDFEQETKRTQIKEGDVLLTIVGALGRPAVVEQSHLPLTLQRSVAVLKPSNAINSRYLCYALESPEIQSFINQNAKGTAQKGIYLKTIGTISIPLAPLNEQRRIADKLETTLAAVEACRQKLNNAAETIQRFRQSVLAAAVSGELTREWREERGVATEWEIQPIEKVADARLGKMLDKSKNAGPERKYIGNINVRWFEFDLSSLATIRVSEEEFQKLSLKRGDLLVCEGGEPGRCAVWEQESTQITYQKALHRIRPKPNIDSHFLSFCFRNAAEDGSLQKLFTGSTIKHLTGRSLSKFLVPVPSKQEQELVISKTLALLEVASTIENKILQTQSVLSRLTSATLSKAFRGELVPQDPSDESASVLLERIKAKREAEAATKKPAKRGRKKKADPAQLVISEGIADNHLAKVLEECGALSELALLAASELEPEVFQLQLAKELNGSGLKQVDLDGETAYADAAWEEEL